MSELARLTELAADRLLGNLSQDEEKEYRRLRARHAEFDEFELERAIAAMHLASGIRPESLPDGLHTHLAADATDFFGAAWRTGYLQETTARKKTSWILYGGWFAAAACLLIAVAIWMERPTRVIVRNVSVAQTPPSVAPLPAPRVSEPATAIVKSAPAVETHPSTALDSSTPAGPVAQRVEFLARHEHLLRRAWRPGNDVAGLTVSGDIVWDPATQTGYMRFLGLRRNEPNAEQYQLWIFDARRDERYPVDGGVFNISGAKDGDVIPIKAKLTVGVPLVFAITIERPGGVVVSDRKRIAALANTS
jgi:hypothetical protein